MRFVAELSTAFVVTIALSLTASPLAIADVGDQSEAPNSPTAVASATAEASAYQRASISDRMAPVTVTPAHHQAAATVSASDGGCDLPSTGTVGTAPSITAADGAIQGTSTSDLIDFADAFNAIRGAHCLEPVPLENFHYSSCMEDRLVWMASDPSTDPASAWGHAGSVRSDGVPSVGCDGNLAGGTDNTSKTVAEKWWDSPAHRASLFRPDIPTGTAMYCVDFAMTHGGVPNEGLNFVRAAARWHAC